MLGALSIFVLVSLSNAQYRSRCGLENEVGTTLKKTEDDIDGRYTVEWCSKLEDEATEWNFKMDYIDFHNGTKQCPQNDSVLVSIRLSRYLKIHSVFVEKLQRPFPDCNITCLSKPLDLLFSGCYMAQNQLSAGGRTWRRRVASLRVDNRFDSAQAINRIRPIYYVVKDGNTLTVYWNLHYIPVLNYSMEIAHYDHKNDTEVKTTWKEIRDNCTHETYRIVCRLAAPRAARCVASALRHDAPWRRGALFNDSNIMRYCSPIVKPESVEVRVDYRVWWAAGALAVALAAMAACWAAHSRLLAALRKRVLRHWTHR
ncbi:uncharacterized protein [Choristoneura fumiferana]|uniref:uncharacterized protein n=1 Tax=Choristoneura fumiferana TaxID=7141 RepID=UPI003D15B6B1